jgi:hypothetical protein
MIRVAFRFGSALLACVVCLSITSSVQAHPVPHKERSKGQIFNVTATQFEWASTGNGTHIGRYTETGTTYYFPDGTVNGFFSVTAADGSTISGIFYGTMGDLGGGFTGFEVTVEWLVGTGRLEGVTGIGSASASVENATGKASITAEGVWERP